MKRYIDQMTATFSEVNAQDLASFPAFKMRVHLRNQLIVGGLSSVLANQATAVVDITIPQQMDDDEMDAMKLLVNELATFIVNMKTLVDANFGGDDTIFLSMIDDVKIELD